MSLTGQVLRVHEAIYKATDGRLGHSMIGVPTLLLRTTGRRSGQMRTSSLVYARDGDSYVIVASKGGADENPAWLLNLRANPDAEVQVGRKRQRARARELTSSDPEYQRLWKLVNDKNHGRYDGYQKLTKREIPLVVLTPV